MKHSRADNGNETVLKIEGTLDAVTAPENCANTESFAQ